jgi:hypothetical protein
MSCPSYRVEEYANQETSMKQVASNQQAELAYQLRGNFLLSLFFNPEDRCDVFL